MTPVASSQPGDALEREVEALPSARTLVARGPYRVVCARAHEIPRALLEIGRLRELTFRAAGEGTGRACDLDDYDTVYRHLFVWNTESREVAGAYRLGATDDLDAILRPRALYTRSLFRFGSAFLRGIGPSLELGRSFVRAEHQRDYGTLMLLWKGIGQFVARNPRYRHLFGPVSISADYRPASRELLVAALSSARYRSPLSHLVAPLHPVATALDPRNPLVAGVDQIETMLGEIEGQGRGMPVLLRQYLRLNAKLLTFSVDPAFSHVVDALAIVDLLDVDATVLQRYLSREGLQAFSSYHVRPVSAGGETRPAVATA